MEILTATLPADWRVTGLAALAVAVLVGLNGALWRRCLGGLGFLLPRSRAFLLPMGFLWLLWPLLMVGVPLGLAVLSALTIVAGFTPGHGSWFDMGTSPKPDNELLRHLFRWFFPAHLRDTFVYDLVGLTIRYAIFWVPVGFFLHLYGFNGIPVMLVGLLVGVVYMLAWFHQDVIDLWADSRRGIVRFIVWDNQDSPYISVAELAVGFLIFGAVALTGVSLSDVLDPLKTLAALLADAFYI